MLRNILTFIVISTLSFSPLVGDSFVQNQLLPWDECLIIEQSVITKLKKLKGKGLSDDQILDTLLEEYAHNGDINDEEGMPQSAQLLILCGGIALAGVVGYMFYYWFRKPSASLRRVNSQQAAGQTSAVQFNFLPDYMPTNQERQAVEQANEYIENNFRNAYSPDELHRAGVRIGGYLTAQVLTGQLPYEHMTVSIRMADMVNRMMDLR